MQLCQPLGMLLGAELRPGCFSALGSRLCPQWVWFGQEGQLDLWRHQHLPHGGHA